MQLPEGEDLNEWLAVHSTSTYALPDLCAIAERCILAVDFFNHLNMLYGTVTEFCIPSEVCSPSWRSRRARIIFTSSALSCPQDHGASILRIIQSPMDCIEAHGI